MASSVRRGNQRPTFEVVGEYARTDGRRCAGLFAAYGVSFYPSQLHELDLFLARAADGGAAAKTIGISKPRQNGKSFAARHYAIWMAAVEGRRVLFTAHHGGTTREMFKILRNFVEGTPDFAAQLGRDGIRMASGNESINFSNGGCIEFNTRTNSVARGKTYDVIVVDEAQELTDEQADALTPTTIASASGSPQMVYLGTPPNHKCPGTVFRQLHERAHAGALGGAWWLEWAADELGDPHDEELWWRCCPAMGYRIRPDAMADAADKSSPDGFFREYLGWWAKAGAVASAIPKQAWEKSVTDVPRTVGAMSVGVKFSPDGERVCVSACRHEDGEPDYVELLFDEPMGGGVRWLAEWLAQRRDRIAGLMTDGKAGAGDLENMLDNMRFPQRPRVRCNSRAVADAAAMLVNGCADGSVEHWADEGQAALDDSALTSPKRRIGDGFGFAGDDATPIESASLALYAARTTRHKPGRKGLVA